MASGSEYNSVMVFGRHYRTPIDFAGFRKAKEQNIETNVELLLWSKEELAERYGIKHWDKMGDLLDPAGFKRTWGTISGLLRRMHIFGEGLYVLDDQAKRIAFVRSAEKENVAYCPWDTNLAACLGVYEQLHGHIVLHAQVVEWQGTYNRERDTIIAFPKRMLEDTDRLHLHPFIKKGFLEIEVHTRLEVLSSPFELPTCDMLSRAQYLNLTPELRVLGLSVEDGLLYLCVHLSREARLYYPHIQGANDLRLIKFCDIHGYILYHRERIDWAKMERLVGTYGLQDPVFYSLYYCNTLYPMEEAERFLSKVEPEDTNYLNEFQTRLYQSSRHRWKTEDFKKRMFSTDRDLEAKQILLEDRVDTGKVKCPKGSLTAACTEEDSLIRISESDVPDWQPFGTHLQSGIPPKDENDLSACCRVAWDEQHFHIDIKVKDDVVLCTEGDRLRDHLARDGVRVYFASFDVREDTKVCIMCPTSERDSNPAFVERNRKTGDCEVIPESKVTCELGKGGYRLYAKLPFMELDIEPDEGREILFDIEIEDCDNPEEGIKSTIVWSGGSGRNLYDRSVYGILQFI